MGKNDTCVTINDASAEGNYYDVTNCFVQLLS